MSPSKITTALRRVLGLTFAPPVRTSVNATRDANRFRPMLECFEDRLVPTTVSVTALGDVLEGGGTTFRVTRDLASRLLTVNLSYSGTATSGTDYSALPSTVTFANGLTTLDVTVTALADNTVEGDETIIASVSSGTGYTPGGSPATVTITDDPPIISVTASDTFEGAATGGFSFTRSGGKLSESLAIGYTVGGTATSVTDYTALSGSVTFAAGVDRVEVAVEALGDNIDDDNETVTATIDDGGDDYLIDEDADTATVHIADQPLTISVIALSDGEEGVSNASFRFLRSGNIAAALTVAYTVAGTAVSGTDFTALSGSVTFAANSDHTDVTVSVINDSTGEPTKTVSVTLNPSDDFSLGNDSDTVFIEDNDTTKVYWISGIATGYSTDWSTAANWSTNAVPTATDDVYFNGSGGPYYSNVNCGNVGTGLSTLYGMHVIGSYSGTLTLANALSVGTYIQESGTLHQPSARDLTVTAAMTWTGGTLGDTDDGAKVNVDGAEARIDPPNTGSMATSSTFRIINSALVNILPGTWNFAAGSGMTIGSDSKVECILSADLLKIEGQKTFTLGADSEMRFKGIGSAELGNRVENNGGLFKLDGQVKLTMTAGNAFTPSYSQAISATAKLHIVNGSTLIATNGIRIDGGSIYLIVNPDLPANLQYATIQAAMTWTGGDMVFAPPITIGTSAPSRLIVRVEPLQFNPCFVDGELPIDGSLLFVHAG